MSHDAKEGGSGAGWQHVTSRPCVCGGVTSDPGNYTGVVWSEALWVEGGCGRWVEGVGGWSPDTPGQLQCKAQGGEPSQGRAGQGSNPKEAKLLNAKHSSSRLSSYNIQQTKFMGKGIFKI